MKKSTAIAFCFLGAVGLYWVVQAGTLDPPDPPAPTMKSLDVIPPTWSQRLDSTNGSTLPLFEGCGSSRFECVMSVGSPIPLPRAVLDRETGLVWERSPQSGGQIWVASVVDCVLHTTGGRRGWRSPTIEELATLSDPGQSDPALPSGHPFLNVTEEGYWSSSTSPLYTDWAWFLNMSSGAPIRETKAWNRGTWCVRGGTPNYFTSQPNTP
jgi:hypothetical protein